ncbi:aromatic ring-hydroxylating dioxygenase subunit alpha [Pelomonas sp. KK5]|uniref:aromatic ring-hydroxylating oxygenase subunit alpha n=1 Tax=Pelomonas sp. KK5 TaxID=1855730 RepID=UPI00097C37BD|nr:Rieske 2Fe-2S domain-containing protein [Pelomonas sp. KK5]
MEFDRSLVRDYWHLLCHRNELPQPGDYLRFETCVGDVVVFHDGDDLVVFDNRCPHRGARIYAGTHGNQAATCSYHGWTHSRGQMIVPHRENYSACDLREAKLTTFPTDWCGDFLFFAITPRMSLHDQLGDAAEILENISFNIGACADVNSYVYDCYWPLAIENALEPDHISLIHPDTLSKLELEAGENIYIGLNSVWKAPVGNVRLRKQLIGLKRFFNIDYGYEGYMSLYLFPFTMLSSTYGYSYSLQSFFPRDAHQNTTNFSSRLLVTPLRDEQAATVLSSFFTSTAQVNRKVFEEDHDICKRVPRSSWSAEPLKFASTAEAKIQHFRQSCRAHLETTGAIGQHKP